MLSAFQSENELSSKNLSLLDHQCACLLPVLMLLFVLSICVTASKDFISYSICESSSLVSESVKLVSFGCFTCFTTFGVLQVTQMFYFSRGMNSSSFVKINLSNLFVCFVAGSTHFFAFAYRLGGICSDRFG
jgi:hypothetical protein